MAVGVESQLVWMVDVAAVVEKHHLAEVLADAVGEVVVDSLPG